VKFAVCSATVIGGTVFFKEIRGILYQPYRGRGLACCIVRAVIRRIHYTERQIHFGFMRVILLLVFSNMLRPRAHRQGDGNENTNIIDN
jgi:hypothetical protein